MCIRGGGGGGGVGGGVAVAGGAGVYPCGRTHWLEHWQKRTPDESQGATPAHISPSFLPASLLQRTGTRGWHSDSVVQKVALFQVGHLLSFPSVISVRKVTLELLL